MTSFYDVIINFCILANFGSKLWIHKNETQKSRHLQPIFMVLAYRICKQNWKTFFGSLSNTFWKLVTFWPKNWRFWFFWWRHHFLAAILNFFFCNFVSLLTKRTCANFQGNSISGQYFREGGWFVPPVCGSTKKPGADRVNMSLASVDPYFHDPLREQQNC